MRHELTLCDFRNSCPQWRPVDDVVMGGVSRSLFRCADGGPGLFSGVLSRERNGGFASVRTVLEHRDYREFDRFRLRIRGDGRRYGFRVRNDDRFDGVVYASDFDTASGRWQEIDLPFSSFRPMFRGSVVAGAPPMDPGSIAQIGLLIASGQEGAFRLEVDWIRVAG